MSIQLHDVLVPRERIILNGKSRDCIEMENHGAVTLERNQSVPATLQIAHSTNDSLISLACLADAKCIAMRRNRYRVQDRLRICRKRFTIAAL